VTSHSKRNLFDIEIDWKAAGLDRPSVVRVLKLQVIQRVNVRTVLGKLKIEDYKKIVDTLNKGISLDQSNSFNK